MTFEGWPAAATLLAAGWIASAGLMAGLWAWHLRSRNAGIVDAGWAASLAGIALLAGLRGDGWAPRRWLLVSMVAVWGGRLTWHLLRDRVLGRPEDARYTELREAWRTHLPLRFLAFFQAQALLAAILSLPVALAAVNGARGWHPLELAAVVLWLAALAGEIAADRQLLAFKASSGSTGAVCDTGLWRYSRHPNYFFEWLVWVAYALYASASPWGWVAWIGPAVILYLLLRVTGIPATEAHAVRSRGDAYRRYQQTTSAFVPWFPGS